MLRTHKSNQQAPTDNLDASPLPTQLGHMHLSLLYIKLTKLRIKETRL